MRKKIVAGNWKMNLSIAEGYTLITDIINKLPILSSNNRVIFCTPYTHFERVSALIPLNNNVYLGAQNCHHKTSGAFTGEISIPMLQESGVDTVIIGHSERRQYCKESNEFLKSKVDALVEAGMQILFCCGEPLDIREANAHNKYVEMQLQESLFHLNADHIINYITIAYEPIWAIGTGLTASTSQAQEMHSYIRSLLHNNYDEDTAESVSILYGGSCNAANAHELFSCKDVDGGLIGGASLKSETFIPIVEAMEM